MSDVPASSFHSTLLVYAKPGKRLGKDLVVRKKEERGNGPNAAENISKCAKVAATMFLRLPTPSHLIVCVRLLSAVSALTASVGGVGLGLFLAGCGGDSHNELTTDVQGIVLSYPETLSGPVTEADLTPVGAGVTVAVQGFGANGLISAPYYEKHPFPQTDASGRFTLKYDLLSMFYQVSLYVPDRCSVTPAVVDNANGINGYPDSGSVANIPSHSPSGQLRSAGKLGDAIKVRYHVASVIVVSDRADACETPQIE